MCGICNDTAQQYKKFFRTNVAKGDICAFLMQKNNLNIYLGEFELLQFVQTAQKRVPTAYLHAKTEQK